MVRCGWCGKPPFYAETDQFPSCCINHTEVRGELMREVAAMTFRWRTKVDRQWRSQIHEALERSRARDDREMRGSEPDRVGWVMF